MEAQQEPAPARAAAITDEGYREVANWASSIGRPETDTHDAEDIFPQPKPTLGSFNSLRERERCDESKTDSGPPYRLTFPGTAAPNAPNTAAATGGQHTVYLKTPTPGLSAPDRPPHVSQEDSGASGMTGRMTVDTTASGLAPADSLGSARLGSPGQNMSASSNPTGRLAAPECETKKAVGTPDYLAPELLLGTGHGPEVDYWALGVILYEFVVGIPPFNANTPEEIFDNILDRRIEWPDEEDMTPECQDLIDKLLTPNPYKRLGHRGAGEIKMHPWFANVDWTDLARTKAAFVPALSDETDVTYFEQKQPFSAKSMAEDLVHLPTQTKSKILQINQQQAKSNSFPGGRNTHQVPDPDSDAQMTESMDDSPAPTSYHSETRTSGSKSRFMTSDIEGRALAVGSAPVVSDMGSREPDVYVGTVSSGGKSVRSSKNPSTANHSTANHSTANHSSANHSSANHSNHTTASCSTGISHEELLEALAEDDAGGPAFTGENLPSFSRHFVPTLPPYPEQSDDHSRSAPIVSICLPTLAEEFNSERMSQPCQGNVYSPTRSQLPKGAVEVDDFSDYCESGSGSDVSEGEQRERVAELNTAGRSAPGGSMGIEKDPFRDFSFVNYTVLTEENRRKIQAMAKENNGGKDEEPTDAPPSGVSRASSLALAASLAARVSASGHTSSGPGVQALLQNLGSFRLNPSSTGPGSSSSMNATSSSPSPLEEDGSRASPPDLLYRVSMPMPGTSFVGPGSSSNLRGQNLEPSKSFIPKSVKDQLTARFAEAQEAASPSQIKETHERRMSCMSGSSTPAGEHGSRRNSMTGSQTSDSLTPSDSFTGGPAHATDTAFAVRSVFHDFEAGTSPSPSASSRSSTQTLSPSKSRMPPSGLIRGSTVAQRQAGDPGTSRLSTTGQPIP
eukprot:gene1643-33035_t